MAQTVKKKVKDNSKAPLVSVVMSVYNGEKHLREAIDSILNQTITDYEFIIINDGSTDDTLKIIKSYKDPRIVLISRKNKGLVASLNEGIKKARGKYIARQDADDISLLSRLEKQLGIIQQNKKAVLIGAFGEYFTDRTSQEGIYMMPYLQPDFARRFFLGNTLMHGSALFNRRKIILSGLYSGKVGPVEDYDLWSRLELEQFIIIPEVLYCYRLNEEGISHQNMEQQSTAAADIRTRLWEKQNPPKLIISALWFRVLSYNRVDRQIIRQLLGDQKSLAIEAFRRKRYSASIESFFAYIIVNIMNGILWIRKK